MNRVGVVAALLIMAACAPAPPKRVQFLPPGPKTPLPYPEVRKTAATDRWCEVQLSAYRLPRTDEELHSDVPPSRRKDVSPIQAEMVIGTDGTITHLRFTQLSRFDSINRRAFAAVRKWRYQPTFYDGEAVEVCTKTGLNLHL